MLFRLYLVVIFIAASKFVSNKGYGNNRDAFVLRSEGLNVFSRRFAL